MDNAPLIAVDVGNSRMKLALFIPRCAQPACRAIDSLGGSAEPRANRRSASSGAAASLPEPWRTCSLDDANPDWETLDRLRSAAVGESPRWRIASVNRPAAGRLIERLRSAYPGDAITLLSAADVPLPVRVPRPDMVGIDRLLDALAAAALRAPGSAAVVVDVGSAVTVDLLDTEGAFCGGAIFPGLGMAAKALHQFTDLLPLIEPQEFAEAPPAYGADTLAAMRAGLYWSIVGAVRELAQRVGAETNGPTQVFITGGSAASLAQSLGPNAVYVPHLTLAGIALTEREQSEWADPGR